MREILFRKDQAEDKGAVMEVKDYPPYLSYPKPRRPQTNGDRIRAMTDEELARFICDMRIGCDMCQGSDLCNHVDGRANGMVKWLQQPAEGGDEG